MSKADIGIAIILAIGAFLGFKRGFLMELVFLLAIVLGIFVGFKLMGWGVTYLAEHFHADTAVLPYLSFILIFIIVMVLVLFLGKRFKNSLDKTFLGRIDAVAGAGLGVIKYAFSLSVAIWLIESIHISLPSTWTEQSTLYPLVAKVAPAVSSFFGDFLPFFKETFKQF